MVLKRIVQLKYLRNAEIGGRIAAPSFAADTALRLIILSGSKDK